MSPTSEALARAQGALYSRRDLLRLAGLAATTWTLSACASSATPSPTPAPPEVQLVYQDWQTDWFLPMAQEMLAQFHEEHPNIQVFYVPDPTDVEERMLGEMQAGTAPDVFQGCCSFLPIWAQSGYTLDLRPYIEADLPLDVINEWDAAQYRALAMPDGQQFALPKYHGALGLFYNRDVFDEYGVAYPTGDWDHADYLAAMKQLTHDRDGDGRTDLWGSMVDVSWDRVQMHVNGWGGHLVDADDPTRCAMAEPEALAALEWLRARMWDDKVMATFLDINQVRTRDAFAAGRLAMVEDGSWALRDVLEGADFRVGVAPFPAGPARRVTLATTDGWGIYANTRHADAAWELLQFLISLDYGRAMAKAAFLQPARSSLINEWAGYILDAYPEQAADLDLQAFADGHLKGYSVTAEVFATMEAARNLTYEAWDQILTLGQASVTRMQTVCRDIDASQRASS